MDKIDNYPELYRHRVNKTYYGIKKIAGKRKEHSLETTDRKLAERRLGRFSAKPSLVVTLPILRGAVEKLALRSLSAVEALSPSGRTHSRQWAVRPGAVPFAPRPVFKTAIVPFTHSPTQSEKLLRA